MSRSRVSALLVVSLGAAACGDEAPQPRPPFANAAGGAAGASGGSAGSFSGGASTAGGAGNNAGGAPSTTPSCVERTAGATDGYEIDDRLPDFELVGEDGSSRRLRDTATTCAGPPSLLVIRVEAAFCGPCKQAADAVGTALLPVAKVPGATPLTVLYADIDGAPATPEDAKEWRESHPGLTGEVAVSADPALLDVVRAHHALPVWLVLDGRTHVLLDIRERPAPDRIAPALAEAWAYVSGETVAVADPSAAKIDGRFRKDEWALIEEMSPVPSPPPSPSNAQADDPAAAALGQALFHDTKLGGDSGVSCATCHAAAKGMADGLPVAQGKGTGKLHTPSIALAAHQRWNFWDGRADTLWSQALGPIENPLEMAGTRLGVVARVSGTHKIAYEGAFGPLPTSSVGLPTSGRPGDPAWDALSPSEQADANRVFVNVGKAIEAFERKFTSPPTRFDAYVAGDTSALDEVERDGLALFVGAGCTTCHYGPRLTDDAFHNVLVPSFTLPADRGRIDGIGALLASDFRADGAFSDDPSVGARLPHLVSSPALLGQVKTPSLRNVKKTGPWGHAGAFETLAEVVAHYAKARPKAVEGGSTIGEEDPTLGQFSTTHAHAIEAFLGTL